MKEVVYLDTYFFINFIMDIASVLITAQIKSKKVKLLRAGGAALFGAAAATVQLLLSLSVFWNVLFSLAILPLILLLAFGKEGKKDFLYSFLFYFATSLFLGGVCEMIRSYSGLLSGEGRVTLSVFVLCLALGYTAFSLWGRGMKRKLGSTTLSLSIAHGEKKDDFYGLIDSGSFLKEPISGFPVILLKSNAAEKLLSEEELLSLRSGKGSAVFPIYAIPLRSAAGEKLLFGFRPENVLFHPRSDRAKKSSRKKHSQKNDRIIIALDFAEGSFAGCPCLVPLGAI